MSMLDARNTVGYIAPELLKTIKIVERSKRTIMISSKWKVQIRIRKVWGKIKPFPSLHIQFWQEKICQVNRHEKMCRWIWTTVESIYI